jgi:hypothetical protein
MLTKFRKYKAAIGFSIRPYIVHQIRSYGRSQTARNELPSEHVHCRRRLSSNVVNAILQTRSGFLWIGTDASESIQRKAFHSDLFSRLRIDAARYCQHAGGRTRWRFVDWYQRRLGPHRTTDVWINLIGPYRSSIILARVTVMRSPVSTSAATAHCGSALAQGCTTLVAIDSRPRFPEPPSAGLRRASTGTSSSLAVRDLSSSTEHGSWNN